MFLYHDQVGHIQIILIKEEYHGPKAGIVSYYHVELFRKGVRVGCWMFIFKISEMDL